VKITSKETQPKERMSIVNLKTTVLLHCLSYKGMGSGEWGIGEWGMGNGEWGMGNGE